MLVMRDEDLIISERLLSGRRTRMQNPKIVCGLAKIDIWDRFLFSGSQAIHFSDRSLQF